MILYQDADSICKRYLVDEDNVAETWQAIEGADFLAASLISYAEVGGALARARRGRRIRSARQYVRITREFEADWPSYYRLAVSEDIVLRAGQLAEKHALTGLDALQLASAIELRDIAIDNVLISAWDKNSGLVGAIQAEGLSLAHEVN